MSKGFFQVIRPGVNTTFQDQGRFNLQHYGLPPGGCMDYKSFLISNVLVQNKKNEGVIEFAYQGPLLKLQEGNTKIAITGDVQFIIITANNDIIKGECYRSYNLNIGDQIDIQSTKNSVYGYLSVEGGFRLESFLNSISTLSNARIGPNNGKKINKEDKIFINKNNTNKNNLKAIVIPDDSRKIRVLAGPQYNYFSGESIKDFFLQEYKVTNLSDRMGMRLQGKVLKNIVNTNIRSEGITKGAIQVPADGQPIILLTDHPTIGGYPKIANIVSADYDLLVQKVPGTNISFKCIDHQEAEMLYKQRNSNISKIIKEIKKIN
jgi:biotin-dependent carboxylase-like uncharacterized protein